jgi:hypothetical protein
VGLTAVATCNFSAACNVIEGNREKKSGKRNQIQYVDIDRQSKALAGQGLVARQIVVFSVDIRFGGPIIAGWRQMLMLLIPWRA